MIRNPSSSSYCCCCDDYVCIILIVFVQMIRYKYYNLGVLAQVKYAVFQLVYHGIGNSYNTFATKKGYVVILIAVYPTFILVIRVHVVLFLLTSSQKERRGRKKQKQTGGVRKTRGVLVTSSFHRTLHVTMG